MDEKIKRIIVDSYSAASHDRGGCPADGNAALTGPDSCLSSIELVQMIAKVEEKVERTFGQPIMLVNEKAFLRESSPFRTVFSLAEYVEELLEYKTGKLQD